jgi:diguanylate cyclase (GGDEF)-like protein
MANSEETTRKSNALRPAVAEVNQSDREMRRIRVLLLILVVVEFLSVVVPRIGNRWRGEYGFLPQVLIGFVVLTLAFTFHLASQRKLLRELSAALATTKSELDRLEQMSPIDPPTQLFNRRYLDELFNHQLKWLNPGGKVATLMLLEVFGEEESSAAAELAVNAAPMLRSNFRQSDYVVRYSSCQFLLVLPETDSSHAQIALIRLIDKVDGWNTANPDRQIGIHLTLTSYAADGNIWETLHELESNMRDRTGIRTFSRFDRTLAKSDDLREQTVQ